jgi:hypothetical protein
MRQTSRLTGKSYYPEDSCIILNVAQVAAYMDNGAELLDVYVGKGKKLCFVFPRDDFTRGLFDKWNKHELN